ncbi:MAG: flavodoxin family protein [Candidatus Aminicenantes bacterium]|nr:flavodoxin family protein [Candidatus Aminicenantes bacterium]
MKKVTAFVGSARKKHTHNAVRQFMNNLQFLGDIEPEIVVLSDYRIETCRGCKACTDKGEEFCPFKDDRNVLIEKIMASDGVVFASPIYSFQVSAIMKIFLDRLGFIFHRPRFFGKTFTNIVVQGIYGGPKIVKYLDFIGSNLGFNTVKGKVIISLEPMTDKQQQKTDRVLAKHSRQFYERLMKPAPSTPTLFKLMIFRMSRTSLKLILDASYRDYTYYRDKGWFESDYFYPTRLGVLKKAAGSLFDSIAKSRARNR